MIAIEMKKSNASAREKQKDRDRLIALTKDSFNDVWAWDNNFSEHVVMSRVMRKIDFGIWQKSITGGGLTALWLLFSRQGAKGQGRRYAARLALDAL